MKVIEKLKKNSFIVFTLKIALFAFVIKIPAGLVGAWAIDALGLNNPIYSASMQEPTLTSVDLFFAIIFAPIVETLIGQFLPIWITSKYTSNKAFITSMSALVFMGMHYPVIEFFPSAFAVGWIFAWAWMFKAETNIRLAFWTVALSHALHNALVALSAALLL